MTSILKALSLGAALFIGVNVATAAETEFLQSLEGNWTGTGTVKVRTDSSPIKVSCNFNSDASATTFELDGKCRGLVVVSRVIKASLRVNGARYDGSYVGAGTGTAGLAGSRSGNAINLGIRWAKEVNGDRAAVLRVTKTGSGMKLTTIDTDFVTGKDVVTSEINLRRL
jgi:membrane-bound inhibitor of C-type lysozyme